MPKFIVKSSDSYNDKNYEIVKGDIKTAGEWLVYTYESRLGRCEVHFSEKRVIISRKGEVSAIIDVDLEKATEFVYATKELRKKFNIKGERITRDEERGIIEFSYKIYDDNVEINKIEISIKNY